MVIFRVASISGRERATEYDLFLQETYYAHAGCRIETLAIVRVVTFMNNWAKSAIPICMYRKVVSNDNDSLAASTSSLPNDIYNITSLLCTSTNLYLS